MRTTADTIREPILIADANRGIYMYKAAFDYLYERFKQQIRNQMEYDYIECIQNPDDEFYMEAFDALEQCVFRTRTGQKLYVVANEDVWLVPLCYMKNKQFEHWTNT